MRSNEAVLANQAWEALFRAQVALARSFTADDIWDELSTTEYDVLYTLSKTSDGLRISELNRQLLLTQTGVSRLVARLEDRRLLERRSDPDDRRAARIRLTPLGAEAQKTVGRRHARAVTDAMTRALGHEQLEQLRGLCHRITAVTEATLYNDAETERDPA